MTVVGANFTADATVRINEQAAVIAMFAPGALIVKTPASDAPGLVDVSVENGDEQVATKAEAFSYLAAADEETGEKG